MTPTEKHMQEHLDWVRECETPNSWEQITYWSVVAVVAAVTVMLAFGAIGYLSGIYRIG